MEGLDELCEFDLAEEPGEDFRERLAAALPGHVELLSLERHEGRRRLAARVVGASYRVVFAVDGAEEPAADAAIAASLAAGARRFDGGRGMADRGDPRGPGPRGRCRRFVERIEVGRSADGEWWAEFTAAVTPVGTARPENVLKALGQARD